VASGALNAAGEERPRAACGRTACTVRCGGGRKPGQSASPRGPGASRRPYRHLPITTFTDPDANTVSVAERR
jgi:hypothetical protein